MVIAFRAGLTLDQFWAMTPHELGLAGRATDQAHEHSMQMLAWHAANIMNCFSKKRVRPQSLYRPTKDLTKLGSVEAVRDHYRKRAEET